jgi:class 3 adenylate cyclase
MNKTDINCLIIFVDIRGFTTWAEKVDNFNFIDTFSEEWYLILDKVFGGYQTKYLGDGAMIIKEIQDETPEDFLQKLLTETVSRIDNAIEQFNTLCKDFSVKKGSKIPLVLGWGMTKGIVKKIVNPKTDFIGAEINRSARYCSIARPFGLVIDATDFPTLPQDLKIKFFKQERKLKGINDNLEVWVTKEIFTQFLTRENIKHSPEVHVAGILFKREDNKNYVLLGKRSSTRRLYPNLYEGCGGQLSANELFTDGVKRHYKLEYGIDNINVIEKEHMFYHIWHPNEPIIPGITFLCECPNEVSIKKKITPENHITVDWVSETEFEEKSNAEFIPQVKEEIQHFFKIFKTRNI